MTIMAPAGSCFGSGPGPMPPWTSSGSALAVTRVALFNVVECENPLDV